MKSLLANEFSFGGEAFGGKVTRNPPTHKRAFPRQTMTLIHCVVFGGRPACHGYGRQFVASLTGVSEHPLARGQMHKRLHSLLCPRWSTARPVPPGSAGAPRTTPSCRRPGRCSREFAPPLPAVSLFPASDPLPPSNESISFPVARRVVGR